MLLYKILRCPKTLTIQLKLFNWLDFLYQNFPLTTALILKINIKKLFFKGSC